MPSIVATIKVKDDKIEEAKAFLKQLSSDTLAKEAGTLVYTVHQRTDDPTTFVFYEKYTSEAALTEHRENLKSAGAGFAGIVAGPPEIVLLEEV
jgi:quinol monooxygenase YgiN